MRALTSPDRLTESETMTQLEYDNEVGAIARNVRDEVRVYGGDASDRIFEAVDSHQWIIYTAYYLDVLKYTSDADYAQDNGLIDADALMKEGGLDRLHQVCAFYAMENDVRIAYDELDDDDDDSNERDLMDIVKEAREQEA